MVIREINTNSKFATVTFNYDELRCLNNSMYQVSRFDDVEKDQEFNSVYAKVIELFALVKHGMIPDFELRLMCKLFFDDNHSEEGEQA
jgi:hypothetical protein